MSGGRHGGDQPEKDIDRHVHGREGGLGLNLGVGQADDATHEEEGAYQAEEPIPGRGFDDVEAALRWVEVQVASGLFGASGEALVSSVGAMVVLRRLT